MKTQLTGKQSRIDLNKNKKIDKGDLKMLRGNKMAKGMAKGGAIKMAKGGAIKMSKGGSYQDAFNKKQKRDSSSQYKMPEPAANDPRKSSYGSTKSTKPTKTSNRVKGTTNVKTETKKRGGNPLFMKKGGSVKMAGGGMMAKGYKIGGKVATKGGTKGGVSGGAKVTRADGIAKKGKTRGRKV